ncbi:PaaI family thioesterase [Nocardioides bizhenqiangii]|uniref:PaaI family thioesterase n=1 Tax=Nocardioides bizhenqiangii TaxID=3095076 RepID=A0ABZ0ZP77_9ACTN|nr:PaaI family thioesterase [Nocardioides sp. HM61]WQQ26032.1 PaaI family thioesterase [Nocardioides sp. HM61]
MSRFEVEHATEEEIAREAALFGPLTDAVRALVDATIRTEVEDEEVRAAQAEVEAIVERLRKKQMDGAYGVRFRPDGKRGRNWGNAVMGLRNAIAPPLDIRSDGSGSAWSDFHLGAAYEGPPGLVHGGVISLMLDQVLGHAVSTSGRPGMTGTLTIVYRRGTPLGDLRCEAWVDHREGIKTWGKGRILDADGEVTAEAEGVFILPKWARKLDRFRAAAEATESGIELE